MIGTIDDVEFVNGEVWAQAGDNVSVNNSTEVIDWDSTAGGSPYSESNVFDLGAGVVENNWVLRFKLIVDNFVQGSDSNSSLLHVGISSSDETLGGGTLHDGVYFRGFVSLSSTNQWDISTYDNESLDSLGTDTILNSLY